MIIKDGILQWGSYINKSNNNKEYMYYFTLIPNILPKKYRYFGYQRMFYDGPHASFGFWWFNISWSTKYTSWKD